METESAKIFASLYALFSGVVFLSTVATFFAPFAHRLMHVLHVDKDEDEDNSEHSFDLGVYFKKITHVRNF